MSDGWYRVYGFRIPLGEILCDGCLAKGSDSRRIDRTCQVRPCVLEKGLPHCGFCSEYTCDRLREKMVSSDQMIEGSGRSLTPQEVEQFIAPYTSEKLLTPIHHQLFSDHPYEVLGRRFTCRPGRVKVLLLTDAYPGDPAEHYVHQRDGTLPWENTRRIFGEAGIDLSSFQDLLDHGVMQEVCLDIPRPDKITADTYTTALPRLEQLFTDLPALRAVGLMGDVAIRAFNLWYRKETGSRRGLIPSIPTYRIHGQAFVWRDLHVFPTYLHTGGSFLIERSKQRMVAETVARLVSFLS